MLKYPIPPPEGADVLRDLDKPLPDRIAERREMLALVRVHYDASGNIFAALVARVVRIVVFHGCVPLLFIGFLVVLGLLWAAGR
jgi:hypothetical protein